MSNAQARQAPFYSVLAYTGFRRLWAGQVISNVGDTFTAIAQLVLVNAITGSTLALAGMAIALALPRLIFGLLAGVVVDRLDRRQVMIVSDVIRAVAVLPMAFVHQPDQIWIFYVCGFLTSAVGTLFNPAKTALLPKLVPESELTRANALSQMTLILATLAGPLLAGFVLEATSASVAFIVDGISFAVSAVTIILIAAPPHERESTVPSGDLRTMVRHVLGEAAVGLRALFETPAVQAVALVFSVVMLGVGAINVLAVAFLTRSYGVGAAGLGMVMTMEAIGMIAGNVVLGQWLSAVRPSRIIGAGLTMTGLTLVLLPFMPAYPLVLALCVLLGLGMAPVEAVSQTLVQTAVPQSRLGRVSAGMDTLITVANLVSMSLAGVAGALIGIGNVFVVGGVITIAAAGLAVMLLRGTPAPASVAVPAGAPAAEA